MLDRGSTYQLRSTQHVVAQDFRCDGAQLGFFGSVDHIGVVLAAEENSFILRIALAGVIIEFVAFLIAIFQLDEVIGL